MANQKETSIVTSTNASRDARHSPQHIFNWVVLDEAIDVLKISQVSDRIA